MSHQTKPDDESRPRGQETVFAGSSPADLKVAESAVAEEWAVGDVILDLLRRL